MKRIHKIRPTGIPSDSRAPFWRGERAETIVVSRARKYKEERLAAMRRRLRRRRKAKK